MGQHVCTWALFSHDMSRKIETHHYAARLNEDFLQCAVYDSDESNARLIGNFLSLFIYFCDALVFLFCDHLMIECTLFCAVIRFLDQ
jgi:hypothetical protein